MWCRGQRMRVAVSLIQRVHLGDRPFNGLLVHTPLFIDLFVTFAVCFFPCVGVSVAPSYQQFVGLLENFGALLLDGSLLWWALHDVERIHGSGRARRNLLVVEGYAAAIHAEEGW